MSRSGERISAILERQAERREVLAKGDTPGHEFHGNQYTTGTGGIGTTSSGKNVPEANHPVYTDRVKRPGWNVKVNALMSQREGGRMLRQRLGNWSKQDHEEAARAHMAAAREKDATWSKTVQEAHQQTFGKPYHPSDYKVSGIARDEYSNAHKEALRSAAHGASSNRDAADAHWRAAGHRATAPR